MNTDWLDTGEYWVDVEEMCAAIMRGTASVEKEAQTSGIFQRELYYYIRRNTGKEIDFKEETAVKGGLIHKFDSSTTNKQGRGRLDAVVNNLVIEYKNHKKLNRQGDIESAYTQVEDYLYSLAENSNTKYNAVLTDGIKIAYFAFNGDEVEHTVLKGIEPKDIDRIIRAILTNNDKKFEPRNILKDFSIDANVNSISKDLAKALYDRLSDNPTEKTKMLFAEWESLTHLSYDDNGKSNDIMKRRSELSLIFSDGINSTESEYKALFALQTAYAIIVKLIACKIIDKLDYDNTTKRYSDLTTVTSDELQNFLEKLEDGYVYRSSNIINLLEGDFFSWYSSEEQWDTGLWKTIIKIIERIDEYSAFSFDITYEPVDIFKDLYISIVPRSVRHSMGEYFTPAWLADYVTDKGIRFQNNEHWKAIDPCCGSGTFIITLIKKIVGKRCIRGLTDEEKRDIRNEILTRVYGIDINPLSVLSARVGYYLALRPFGEISNVEIPVYLGDSAITPIRTMIADIPCYKYQVLNRRKTFNVVFPERFVRQKDFCSVMASLQTAVKTDNADILYAMIENHLSDDEKGSEELIVAIRNMSDDLVELHKNNWDGIWIRIATNFMLIARLSSFDLIVGNPPWVKWEHLPSRYAQRIKELCDVRHIFSTRGQFGGTQLNICALIANITATNWLSSDGVLAFLMPDSIMSQNSYEEFRYFYTDYQTGKRLYLQAIDKWEKPLKPFTNKDFAVSQDFNTYYYMARKIDYSKGIPVTTITRKKNVSDLLINELISYKDAKKYLITGNRKAAQLSPHSSAFSYIAEGFDFSAIIGESAYEFRTGVEFTPQELYMLIGVGPSSKSGYYRFANKKFAKSKYIIDDMPKSGWELPTGHIYPIVTGPSLTPFKTNIDNEYCIVPYDEDNTEEPVIETKLMKSDNDLFMYLLSHREIIEKQSEKSKLMRRGEQFYSLSKIGPYTFAPYIVAARDNTKFCASVVKSESVPWGGAKQNICVKHTIIISRDIKGRFITEDEAYYICGILNSDIVIRYIENTFKSNGYSLKKAHLFIPEYDTENRIHLKISTLSRKASEVGVSSKEIKDVQSEISDLYIKLCGR